MTKRFLKDNFIFMASTVLGGMLGYFFHFVVSRKLSVAEYGELQAITSLSIIFGVFASALSFFIIKYSSVFASHGDRAGQAAFLSFLIRKFRNPVLGIFIVYLSLVPILKFILHLKDYLGLIAIGCSIIFFIFSAFYANALQGWKKFLMVGAVGVAATVVKLAGGYALASALPTASVVSFSILISAVLGWFLARFFSRREWPAVSKNVPANDWREKYFGGENFRKSFASILFFSLALAAASNLDIIFVKNMTSSELAGYYGALSVLGKIVMWLNLAVVAVLFPEACSSGYLGRPADSKSVLGSYGLIFAISLPALVIYYFFSGFLVSLLFGEKYAIISQNLWLFGAMALFLSLLTLEANLAMARRDFRSTWLLGAVAVVLASAVFLHHANLREIILSVIFSFSIGWVFVLGLNLNHRFSLFTNYETNESTKKIKMPFHSDKYF